MGCIESAAYIGFVASGNSGHLEVPDIAGREVPPDFLRHIAFHDLAMVQVELNPDIWFADFCEQSVGVVLAIQEKAGHVAWVDRFDKNLNPMRSRGSGGSTQVCHKGGAKRVPGAIGWNPPSWKMNPRAIQCLGVAKRAVDGFLKLTLSPRKASNPSFAVVPVARRRVEEDLHKMILTKSLREPLRVMGVREEKLDTTESIPCRCLESVEKGQLRVEHRQVGGESGHMTGRGE